MVIRQGTLLLLFLFFIPSLSGQSSSGLPLIRNYLPQEYGSHRQNWAITQTPDQLMYIANGKGVLQYDGENWQLIMVPNRGHVRSIASDEKGRVYVGANNDLGYLKPNAKGQLQFESLLKKVPANQRDFGRVYSTTVVGDAVYWQTNSYIFRWQNNELVSWSFANRIRRMAFLNGKLYIADQKRGLYFLGDKGEFVPASGGEALAGKRVSFMISSGQRILIGTRRHGLMYYDGQQFIPFKTEIDLLENDQWFGRALYLPNNYLVLNWNLNKGIAILDPDGRLIYHIDADTGLSNNDVLNIYLDRQNGIWCALQEGLARIDVLSPFSIYDARLGLEGTIQAIDTYKGQLYAGSSQGIVRLENKGNKMELANVPGIKGYVWALRPWNDKLLVGTTYGTFLYDGQSAKQIQEIGWTSHILVSQKDSNLVYFVSDTGMSLLEWQDGRWKKLGTIGNIRGSTRAMIETSHGEYWFKTRSNGIFRLRLSLNAQGQLDFENPQWRHYRSGVGVPAGENNIFLLDTLLLLRTEEDQVFRYIASRDSFQAYNELAQHFGLEKGYALPKHNQQKDGSLWLDWINDGRHDLAYIERPLNQRYKATVFPINQKLQSFKDIFSNEIFFAEKDKIWFSGMNGMISYDLNKAPVETPPFPTYVYQVKSKDSLLYSGYQMTSIELDLPYGLNDLIFSFTAPLYQDEDHRSYQYQLEGYDQQWSDWTSNNTKQYTNLSEGKYNFRLRAKDSYGNVLESGQVVIQIAPPWHRSILAYLAYLISGLAAIFGFIHFRSRRLRQQNLQLEQTVSVRTQTIQQQADELKELNEVKSRFFANISHELRTPLTLILSPITDMLQLASTNESRNQFQLIQNNAQRLLRLINQLLDLSKLDDKKLELRASQANIVDFCRNLTISFETLAQQKGLLLEFKTSEEEIFLYFDEEKMEHILLNLISNAIKFTLAGGKVSIEVNKTEVPNQKCLEIQVKDTGIGMTEEQLPHIFDRFYQTDDADTKAFAGSGIGLSLAKELVELHQGSLQVESQRGMGSCFILTFPLGRAHLKDEQIWTVRTEGKPLFQEQKNMVPIDQAVTQKEKSSEKPSLLVVDDHSELRQYIIQKLQGQFNCIEASNGMEAWEQALAHTPDLIISDVMMPGMNGYQLCDKIKGDIRTNHIPLILLTAKSGTEEKIKGLSHQADEYLTKPFNSQELRLRVANLIRLRNRLRLRFAGQILFDNKETKTDSQEEVFLKKLAEIVDKHLADNELGVDLLSQTMGMSRSQLNRKMRSIIGKSPNQYIRSYRLARARQLIEKNTATISEISFETGFSSPAYFSKCFLDEYGYSPKELKSKS